MINVEQGYGLAGLAHELKHGFQFETKQLDFTSIGTAGLLYDITDEIGAFKRQEVFTSGSAMLRVNESFVRNLRGNDGSYLYRSLPGGPLNVNISLGVIDMQYRSQHIHLGVNPASYNTLFRNTGLPFIFK